MNIYMITAAAYILGSIPFGLVWAKLLGHGDLRNVGSGNIGATNALRTGSKKLAILTLLCDMLKGTVAVVLARHFAPDTHAVLYAGFAAIAGHIWPVWLKFKGGKGVATILGVLLGWSWPVALVVAGAWLVVAFLGRYSSLAAMLAIWHSPVYAIVLGQKAYALPLILLALLASFTHRQNIARLLKGEEGKIKLKKG
jgi:acyl phosphate:glycerol-3-phosphate acyltransferase